MQLKLHSHLFLRVVFRSNLWLSDEKYKNVFENMKNHETTKSNESHKLRLS